MASTKKKNIAGNDSSEEIPQLTAAEAAAPAVGREYITKKQIFSRPITPETETESEAKDDDEGDPEIGEGSFGENGDDLEPEDSPSFFGSGESTATPKVIQVYKMTDPSQGARLTKGGQVYLGDVQETPDYRKVIQETWGGGQYRLLLMGFKTNTETGKRRYGILESENLMIAPPSSAKVAAQVAWQAANSVSPQTRSVAVGEGIHSPTATYQPPSVEDELTRLVRLKNLIAELSPAPTAPAPAPTPPPPPVDPEVMIFKYLAGDEDIKAKMTKGLIGKLFGATAAQDPEPWYAEVVKDAVKSGQGVEMVKAGIEALFGGISNLFPSFGGNNGRSPMATPPVPNHPVPNVHRRPHHPDGAAQGQPQGQAGPPQSAPPQHQAPAGMDVQSEEELGPRERMLIYVLEECAKNSPREAVLDGLVTFAGQINEADPLHSVDWYLQAFSEMPTDQALKFVEANVPGANEVTALPHAQAWTAELQALIKEHYSEETESE